MRRAPAFLLAALLAGCSGGSPKEVTVTTAGAPASQTATVAMTDRLRFHPDVVLAKVGTVTLTADNQGGVPHNLVFDDAALGKTKTISGRSTQSLRLVFTRPGTFRFQCTFHSGMTGKVIVS